MKDYIKYFVLLIAAATVFSCKVDDIEPYSVENSAVVFLSTSSSFSLKGVTEDQIELKVPVKLIGPKTDYDRKISVSVTPSADDKAMENEDFTIKEAVLKAGELSAEILISVKNLPTDVEMLSTTVNIVPNEYFIAGRPVYSKAKIIWSKQYVRPKPDVWRDWYFYFSHGYSRAYHELLIKVVGEEVEYSVSRASAAKKDPTLQYKIVHWWFGANRLLRDYVSKYDREHPDAPLMHSADYEEFAGYNVAVGEGKKPEVIPTILSTLEAI